MRTIDLTHSWQPMRDSHGLWFRLLSGDIDETERTGFRTRLVRFDAAGRTCEPFRHEYWEEVYLVEGDLAELTDHRQVYRAPAYVIRPPGTSHGPFESEHGCLLIEMHYFASRSIDGAAGHP